MTGGGASSGEAAGGTCSARVVVGSGVGLESRVVVAIMVTTDAVSTGTSVILFEAVYVLGGRGDRFAFKFDRQKAAMLITLKRTAGGCTQHPTQPPQLTRSARALEEITIQLPLSDPSRELSPQTLDPMLRF